MEWEVVVGLEIHVQLSTESKIFSGSSVRYGAPANTQANLVDLGYPGVLPVLNQQAVHMAIKFGLATQSEISARSVFARKNYFYPDLPKGYQISQYELPIVRGGHINISLDDGSNKTIRITRAHLEEDAGKSLHDDFHGLSGIDLNRAGIPLLEIVSEPDMRSALEAGRYMRKIHTLVRYLGISDGNMQEGSFRCDANASVRPKNEDKLGVRTELKNLNSFRFVEKAIDFEVERQISVLEDNGQVVQETRLYDSEKNETRPMRGKEEANDYRYFPDPDLLPVVIDKNLIDQLRRELPELPDDKWERFVAEYKLSPSEASVLISNQASADYFEVVAEASSGSAKTALNWMTGSLAAALNREDLAIEKSKVDPIDLATLINRTEDGTLSSKLAKTVFEALWEGEGTTDEIIQTRQLQQITDSNAIENLVEKVIGAHPEQAEQFRSGKNKVLGFFVGQVMKACEGKANPEQVNSIVRSMLKAQ